MDTYEQRTIETVTQVKRRRRSMSTNVFAWRKRYRGRERPTGDSDLMIPTAQSHAPGVAVPSESEVSAEIYMRFVARFEPRVIRPGAESTSDAKGTEVFT